MLILTRKSGESVVMDGGIRVTVLSVHGTTVRLGVEAPKATRIARSELLPRVCRGCYQTPCICLPDSVPDDWMDL